ncbi:AMP-binding protein [Primorskyibacter sp. S187A]|uniref:AMP-binding protein n=1 Tax=Primorskyibacter sp. S187A TaxID=3415130 RepID=UPI003C7AA67C
MLRAKAGYEDTRAAFRWDIPERYNIGVDVCDRLAEATPQALALRDVAPGGAFRDVTFGALRARSNQLAHVLQGRAQPGDRVGVLLAQCEMTALAHIAAFKMGAISLPLFTLFGPDALLHRLKDSGARVVITDAEGAAKLEPLRAQLPELVHVLTVADAPDDNALEAQMASQSPEFTPVDTAADDPALLIYTSGTTGHPKGALHAHRVLLGHLPGVEMSHDFLPQEGDRIWTPADWAWIGGLLDVLLPALHHGVPVVAHRFRKFTAEAAFDFIETHGIRNAFLPPTALKLMRQAEGRRVQMRSVASGGETLGAELLDWGRDVFGVTINEFYGQTECNMVVSSCAALAPAEPGVMGWAVPGHEVAVIDPSGAACETEEEGDIAVVSPDPVMFLKYWNRPEATDEKFRTGPDGTRWLLTGDRGWHTSSGRIAYKGRDDDVISSSGYRVGPAEIEDCLLTHPSVAMAGVVGQPDKTRGEIIVAYVTLTADAAPGDALAQEISDHVRTRLAAYEAPRAVRFLDEMPLTTTGKIIRRALREHARGVRDQP